MDAENEPVLETDLVAKERDLALENAVSISRQWGVLLDDYRYLLQKFSTDCSCHLRFDNMYFLKSIEQKYEAMKKMANDNEYLSAFSNDDNDWSTINAIWQKRGSSRGTEASVPGMIRRITVINDTEISQNSTLVSDTNASTTNDSETIQSNSSKRSKRPIERIEDDTNETTINESDGLNLNLPSKVYKCEVKECDFTTMSKGKCQAHVRYHQGVSNPTPEADSVYQICHHCSKEFPTEDGLKNHIQNSHVDVKIWNCEAAGCDYKTKFRSCFRDHMTRHTGKKSFHCDWEGCGKDFRTKRDLMAHINFHHRCIRRFTCTFPDCTLSFKDSNRLKHHQYIHTGERPYKCKFRDCDSSFKQIPHLKKHEKIHLNKQAEEEQYEDYAVLEEGQAIVCPGEDCGQAFISTPEFHEHVRENHPNMDELYGCFEDNCNSVFASLDETVKHMHDVHGQVVETEEAT